MLGLMYKDLCLIKKDILTIGISIVIFILVATCIPFGVFPSFPEDGLDVFFPAYLLVMLPFGFLMVPQKLVEIDERRRWSGFIISGPIDYKQQILSKYYLAMVMSWLAVVIHVLGEVIGLFIPNTVSGLTGITVMGFYGVILYQALEFPFDFRYGSKNGVKYKMGLFLLLFYGFMMFVLFGPNLDTYEMIDYLFRLAKGEVQLPRWMQYMGVFLPYVSIGAYYISYKISCRWYLKGVEQYEV